MSHDTNGQGLVPAAAADLGEIVAAEDSHNPDQSQVACPIEIHDPVPHDKVVCFEVPRIHLLVGVWQGPATIAQLRRDHGGDWLRRRYATAIERNDAATADRLRRLLDVALNGPRA